MVSVSVIIPTYNVSEFIGETLDSVISQTYKDFEILVIDDGSSDNTAAIIESYKNRDRRINLFTNTHTKGVSGARNTGIEFAQGEWIAFLDGDDLWSKDSLEQLTKAAVLYKNADLISGNYANFDSTSENICSARNAVDTNEQWKRHFGEAFRINKMVRIIDPLTSFLPANLVNTGTLLVRSSIIKKLNGFDESLLNCEDNQLWLKTAASIKEFVFVPHTIMFRRLRDGSLTRSNISTYEYGPQAFQALLNDPLFENHKNELKLRISKFIRLNSFFYRNNKQRWKAIQWSFQDVLHAPISLIAWKNILASLVGK